MDLSVIDQAHDKFNQYVGSDSVTVAKGVFSAKVRAEKMCKTHAGLPTVQGSVRQFYDDCFSASKKDAKTRILSEFGVFTLTWKCEWNIFTNTIHTQAYHRALTPKEAAYFTDMKKAKGKLGF